MKISVLMPAFDAARFVAEQIEAVLAQDAADFELLALDDGSRDDTWSVLAQWRRHPRVRLWRQRRRQGAAASRNRLARHARGRYIVPCDADDLMLPGNLRRQSEVLDQRPEVCMVYGAYLILDTDARQMLTGPPWIRGAPYASSWDMTSLSANHAGSMVRRSVLRAVGGYDARLPALESLDLILRIAERSPIEFLSGEVLYAYRRNPWSTTRKQRGAFDVARQILRAAHLRRRAAEARPEAVRR